LVYTAIVTPYMICFSDNDPQWSEMIDYILYVSFFIDLVLNFLTGYLDHDDNIVTSRQVKIINKK